jgi:hypothetical protein
MTNGYSMPFWLWAGIIGLVLSVVIPAILGIIRKRKKSTPLPVADDKEESTRMVAKLVTPLQIEAFQLTKELRNFVDEMGDKPDVSSKDFPDTRDGQYDFIVRRQSIQEPWRLKFKSLYNSRFAARVQRIVQQFGINGIQRTFLDTCVRVGIEDDADAQQLIESIISATHQLDGIYVFPRTIHSGQEIEMMSEAEKSKRMGEEPGFVETYKQHLQSKASGEKRQ